MRPDVQVMEIAPGEAGIFQSLTAMRLGVLKEAGEPSVHETALQIVGWAPPAGDDSLTDLFNAQAIYRFVKARMDYVPDPDDVEAVGLASYHLLRILGDGKTQGDCDDAAVLVATLASSIGLPARFAVASFRPSLELHHVWAEVFTRDAGWQNLDTFRTERLQLEPTRVEYVSI